MNGSLDSESNSSAADPNNPFKLPNTVPDKDGHVFPRGGIFTPPRGGGANFSLGANFIHPGGGKGTGMLGNKFVGLLAAFAVYDKALTAAELTRLCNTRLNQLKTDDDHVFDVSDYGAMDDGITNNTAAFSSCVEALLAAGGGKMVLPRSRLGIYIGNIIIPPTTLWTTVEIVGGVQPTPVFGTVGNLSSSFCTNCSHVVLQSLEASGPAVIQVAAGGSGYENFNSIFVTVQNLEVRTYDNPGISGIDVGFAQQCNLLNVFINTGVYAVVASRPVQGTSGLITPICNNGAYTMLRNIVISGFFNGIVCNEHTDGDGIVVAACVNGLSFEKAFHASRFGRVGSYRNQYQITAMGTHGFAIQQLAIEIVGPGQSSTANAWQKTVADINDPRNLGFADVTYWVVEGNVGAVANFSKIGGANIQARRIGAGSTCTP